MKEYKLIYLNKGFSSSREKDLVKAEEKINEMTDQGWELQQVVSPDDGVGALIGVFYKERKLYGTQAVLQARLQFKVAVSGPRETRGRFLRFLRAKHRPPVPGNH